MPLLLPTYVDIHGADAGVPSLFAWFAAAPASKADDIPQPLLTGHVTG
jgi:hypothetical protein